MADRVEREIEEILRKVEKFPGRTARGGRKVGKQFGAAQGWVAHRLARVSLRQVMMWAIFAVVVSFFVRGIPGASWIMIGGIIVAVTAYLLSRQGVGTGRASQRRWRGEPIDYSTGPAFPTRVKSWLKGRKRV